MYFLSCVLADVIFEEQSLFARNELEDLINLNLSSSDQKKVQLLYRYFDLKNIAFFLGKKEILFSCGEITQNNVEDLYKQQCWKDGSSWEDFMKDFFLTYPTYENQIKNYSILMRDFLLFYKEKKDGFLKKFFSLEQDLRVILAGFRAKILSLSLEEVLKNEDSKDPVVLEVLAQKDSPLFIPPYSYEDLQAVIDLYDEPILLDDAFNSYERDKVMTLIEGNLFSTDFILSRLTCCILGEIRKSRRASLGEEVIKFFEKA